eukprot:459062-Hanusia_phi.AAC.1
MHLEDGVVLGDQVRAGHVHDRQLEQVQVRVEEAAGPAPLQAVAEGARRAASPCWGARRA